MRYFLLFLATTLFSFAADDCEIKNDSAMVRAYQLFIEAENSFDDEAYKDAYDKINESYKLYASEQSSIGIAYECTHYVQEGYIPKITTYNDTQNKSFKRKNLAILIKKYLNPNPYILIQQLPQSTKVTVANVKKTSRGSVEGQLSLENVSVRIGSRNVKFADITSNTQKTETLSQRVNLDRISVSMDERFDIALFSH